MLERPRPGEPRNRGTAELWHSGSTPLLGAIHNFKIYNNGKGN